tara:strand:- start:7 stop:252 length:246 start_codon:yes stop_codon:yes gene_type:complete
MDQTHPDYGMHNLCNLYYNPEKGYLRGSFMFWTFWCFPIPEEQRTEENPASWRLSVTMRLPKNQQQQQQSAPKPAAAGPQF